MTAVLPDRGLYHRRITRQILADSRQFQAGARIPVIAVTIRYSYATTTHHRNGILRYHGAA